MQNKFDFNLFNQIITSQDQQQIQFKVNNKMQVEQDDFKCQLKTNLNYSLLIDQDQVLQDMVKDNNDLSGLQDYIKKEILNDIERLNKLLQKLHNDWKNKQDVNLKRIEIFTLIILMFFNLIERNKNFGRFYIIHMDNLKQQKCSIIFEKLQCIKNYITTFYKKKDQLKNDNVRFIKNSIIAKDYNKQKEIKSQQKIEIEITKQLNEEQLNSTVVDFADKNIGGLTLKGKNCAQEEILMLIFPEALISMIFIPPMQNHEAILIQNLKKFSNYSGYQKSFQCKNQQYLEHSYNFLAIDAKKFPKNQQIQFKTENLERELLKCYSGFQLALRYQPDNDISTGRWGCGIFKGNQYLKTIIQLICFAQAKHHNQIKGIGGKAKLILNCTKNNIELYQFGLELKKQNLNLDNLSFLIERLENYEFNDDKTFSQDIIKLCNKQVLHFEKKATQIIQEKQTQEKQQHQQLQKINKSSKKIEKNQKIITKNYEKFKQFE